MTGPSLTQIDDVEAVDDAPGDWAVVADGIDIFFYIFFFSVFFSFFFFSTPLLFLH